jgi:hypothetical protein
MKKILIITAFIFLFALLEKANCQSIIKPARYRYGNREWKSLWSQQIKNELKNGNFESCLISVTFAKFIVDSHGAVIKIEVSENNGTPPIFREKLVAFIKSTSGSWTPATNNGKPLESKPFILPFIYKMESGCAINKKNVNDGTSDALLNLLSSFHDIGENGELECTLLKPLVVFSQN